METSQVLNRIAKTFTCITVIGVIGIGAAMAQAPAKPEWKDQAEYDLFKQATTTAEAAKRLPILDSWKDKYADSAFKKERLVIYLTTYQALAQTPKAVETAKEILTLDPSEVNALYFLTNYGQIQPPTADSMATGEKAAMALLELNKAPQGVEEAAWAKMKTDFAITARKTLGFIATAKKDFEKTEQEYVKALQLDPTQAQISYMLGNAILGQKKPERQSEVLYHWARAASLTGPGALAAATQKQIDAFFVKQYTAFHGKDEAGLKELRQLAISQPMPPTGFKIMNVNELEAASQEKLAKENPQLALWKGIKDQLVAANGDQYFESGLKGSAVPKLRGKLVSMKPATRPKELVLSMEASGTPEVTLVFETPLPGKAEAGTEIQFEGIPSAFTKEPFMLTFEVEGREKIEGWPAQAAPTPKARPGAGKKKKGE